MAALPKSPYARAKIRSRYGRCSVDDLRREIRNDFRKRLKYHRSKSVDRHRDSLGLGHIIEEGYNEIRSLLLSDIEAVQFLDENKLNNLLDDVQMEILKEELQEQAEKREVEEQKEIDAIIDSSLIKCNVCETILDAASEQSIMCDKCVGYFEGEV